MKFINIPISIEITSLIKTPCGREKYSILSNNKGILSKIRLIWFILIATLKDWNLPNPDQIEKSDS